MTTPPSEPPIGDRGSDPRPRQWSSEPTDTEVDAAFAAMTAHWETRDAAGPQVVDAEVVSVRDDLHPSRRHTDTPAATEATEVVEFEDEGHFEPPEPPPVPTLARATVGALALIVLGTMLLLVPGVVGLGSSTGFPLGLIVVSGGLAWLLSRLRPGPPVDSGWDDGAQI